MGMQGEAPASPDAFVDNLSGWRRDCATTLRDAIKAGAPFDETIKWHNLVFVSNGPCILIHAEESRVLLGFWRGKQLTQLDSRIKPSGKYELANITFVADTPIDSAAVTRLAAAAAALNAELGDPTALP
jgi:hypothetical protein